jgi:hypothetical protein
MTGDLRPDDRVLGVSKNPQFYYSDSPCELMSETNSGNSVYGIFVPRLNLNSGNHSTEGLTYLSSMMNHDRCVSRNRAVRSIC